MNKDKYTNINLTEAAWLAGRLGLNFGPLSPLKKAAEAVGTDDDKGSLAGKGLLDGAGNVTAAVVSCMKTVANPGCELAMDVGNASLLNFMKVYFGDSGVPAGCTPLDASSFRLSSEVKLEDVLLAVLEGLDISPEMKENPFSCDLSQKALLALAALLDATRQSQLRGLLNRNDNIGLLVDFLDVQACMQRGLVEDDLRWLTGVVRSRLPDELTVDQKVLSEGLAEVLSAGLAVREDDSWGIAEDRVEYLSDLMTPLSFGSIFARSSLGSETVRLFLVRCPASLWAVNYSVKGGKVSIFTLPADRLGTVIAETIANLIVIGKKVPAVAGSVPTSIPQAPAVHDPVKKFCPECGKPLKPGARFCAECGHKI